MRDTLVKDPEAFALMQQGLWPLEMREEPLMHDEYYLALREFSPASHGQFYQLLESVEPIAASEEISQAKEYLKRDAEQELMRKILTRL